MSTKIFIGFGVFLLCGYCTGQNFSTTSSPRKQKCGKHEKWVKCGMCEPSCEVLKPQCTFECRPSRCQCKHPFVRNDATGECVPRKQCNATRSSTPSVIRIKRQFLLTTTTTPTPFILGGPAIVNQGPMIPAPGQPIQPSNPVNPFNPGLMISPQNGLQSCQDGEEWQTCNPCEKTCHFPNFPCPTQVCSTTTSSPLPSTPSPLGLGVFGLPPFLGRCVCKSDKVRRMDGKCVDANDCNSGGLPVSNIVPGQSIQPGQPQGLIQPQGPALPVFVASISTGQTTSTTSSPTTIRMKRFANNNDDIDIDEDSSYVQGNEANNGNDQRQILPIWRQNWPSVPQESFKNNNQNEQFGGGSGSPSNPQNQ